jgi:hypothetical protein
MQQCPKAPTIHPRVPSYTILGALQVLTISSERVKVNPVATSDTETIRMLREKLSSVKTEVRELSKTNKELTILNQTLAEGVDTLTRNNANYRAGNASLQSRFVTNKTEITQS